MLALSIPVLFIAMSESTSLGHSKSSMLRQSALEYKQMSLLAHPLLLHPHSITVLVISSALFESLPCNQWFYPSKTYR
jgi:hypothetical protein